MCISGCGKFAQQDTCINDGPVRLGGPGVIVQTDELRHKQKVVVYVGHRPYTITRYSNIAFSFITSPTGGMDVWVGEHLTPHSQGLYASGGQKECQHVHPSHQGPYIAKHNNSLSPVGSLCPNSSFNPSIAQQLMWRERYGVDPSSTFTCILADIISIQYPV